MLIDNSRKAVRRYDLVQHPNDHPKDSPTEPAVPVEPGQIHAVLYEPPTPEAPDSGHPKFWSRYFADDSQLVSMTAPLFRVATEHQSPYTAACGARVKVVYPMKFSSTESDACPRCVELAVLRQTNRSEYERRRLARAQRLREEMYQDDLESFYERQAEDLRRQEQQRQREEHDRKRQNGTAG